MTIQKFVAITILAVAAAAAQPPAPSLRIEAVDAGSILYVTNRGAEPMTAYLIEMLHYPGTNFYNLHDDPAAAVAPGVEKKIPLTNMTIGAAPEYVKITAAIFADGSTVGDPPKVALLLERRRAILETTRELIRRATAPDVEKAALLADLRKWAETLQVSGRTADTAIVPAARRSAVDNAIQGLGSRSVADVVVALRASEARLAAGKPAI